MSSTHATHSSVFNINTGAAFLASSGAQHFLGAGHASYVGCAFSRTFGQVAAYGLGGTICADVGDLEIIASPTAVIAGLSASAMLSLQYFMAGAGVCLDGWMDGWMDGSRADKTKRSHGAHAPFYLPHLPHAQPATWSSFAPLPSASPRSTGARGRASPPMSVQAI